MKKKGFTLVELLVVIAIIAMLLAILMPALNRVRQLAYRLVCGTNLGGLGKAMASYANDYAEQYPVAGNSSTTWGPTYNYYPTWDALSTATPSAGANTCNITSALYLLVKYSDVGPKSFVCSATDTKKFELELNASKSSAQNYTKNLKDITEAWDFGGIVGSAPNQNGPWDYCSYSYQMPYKVTGSTTSYPLTASSQAGLAVMADKSPWYDKGQVVGTGPGGTAPQVIITADLSKPDKPKMLLANSPNHTLQGQNVLYMDSHTAFEALTNVGVENDNIYTPFINLTSTTAGTKQGGKQPTDYKSISLSDADSFLAN